MATPFIDQNLIRSFNPKLQLDTSVHVFLQCGSVRCRLTCSRHRSGCPPQRYRAEPKVLVLSSWPALLPLQEITVWAQFGSFKWQHRWPIQSPEQLLTTHGGLDDPLNHRFHCASSAVKDSKTLWRNFRVVCVQTPRVLPPSGGNTKPGMTDLHLFICSENTKMAWEKKSIINNSMRS